MVEKPLTISLEDALAIRKIARYHHVHVLVNYETTWYSSNRAAYELVHQNALGGVRKIVVHDGHEGPKEINVQPEFLAWLTSDFKLSDYQVEIQDGQLVMRFSGLWTEVTMWEIYGLALMSELKTRAALSTMNELELDVLYARAKTKLWEKIERLRAELRGLVGTKQE